MADQVVKANKRERSLHWLNFVRSFFVYLFLGLGAFVSLVPFVWMIATSFKSLAETMTSQFFPKQLMWQNYVIAWERALFSKYFMNSLSITLITLAGSLTLSILAAYAFARIEFPGRDLIFGLLLSTMMIPAMVNIIPNFLTVTWLGRIGPIPWINNWPALTIPFMGSVFNIFLLRQFFAQVPDELYDATRIDGGGHLRFLLTVKRCFPRDGTAISGDGTWTDNSNSRYRKAPAERPCAQRRRMGKRWPTRMMMEWSVL
jgi:ABC-type glycerol-3-phosphate transport system permease component